MSNRVLRHASSARYVGRHLAPRTRAGVRPRQLRTVRNAAVVGVSAGLMVTMVPTGANAAAPKATPPDQISVTSTSTSAKTVTSASLSSTTLAATPLRGARAGVISSARRYIGVYYRYGGTTPRGFDCSGFTQYVYRKIGVSLPRTSSQQRYAGPVVPRSQGLPGDLVWMPGHVGIYLGNGMMIDSPRTGKAISVRKIWRSDYKLIRVIHKG